MGIDVRSPAQREIPPGAFDDKPEFLVEMDGRSVVHVDCQLDPVEAKPVVGEINQCGHQGAAHAAPLKVVVDCHADAPAMVAAWGGFHLQARDADHSPIELSDQEVCVGRALCEALPPLFNRAKGELERSGDDTGAVPNLRDGLDVSWLGCTIL